MAHSLELLFDDRADTLIRRVWRSLADAGLPSQQGVKSPTNRPHVTLLAAERISPDSDAALGGLTSWFPMPCLVGAPLVFGGGGRLTLARLVVPSARLIGLHGEVYRRALPHVGGEPFAHSAPGHWTPHATLGRRLVPGQVGEALAIAEVSGDFPAQIVGLRRWDGDARQEFAIT